MSQLVMITQSDRDWVRAEAAARGLKHVSDECIETYLQHAAAHEPERLCAHAIMDLETVYGGHASLGLVGK